MRKYGNTELCFCGVLETGKMGWIFRVFGWDVAGGLKATESDRKERCGEVVRGVVWVG